MSLYNDRCVSGRGDCDESIALPEESYLMLVYRNECHLETSTIRMLRPTRAGHGEKKSIHIVCVFSLFTKINKSATVKFLNMSIVISF